VLDVLYNSKKLGLSLKLDLRCLDRVLNSISVFCNFQIHKLKKKILDRVSNSIQTSTAQKHSNLISFQFFSFTKIKKRVAIFSSIFSVEGF
jgi:hypothetical protein